MAADLSPAAVMEAALAEILGLPEADAVLTEIADAEQPVTFFSTRSFSDAGVLTTNSGLVVRLTNGQEFQITIVQSR